MDLSRGTREGFAKRCSGRILAGDRRRRSTSYVAMVVRLRPEANGQVGCDLDNGRKVGKERETIGEGERKGGRCYVL